MAQLDSDSRKALHSQPFRRFFYASIFATMAVWISRFLIGWVTWEFTKSSFWVGTVSAALLLPTIFLSPLFGAISDRINPRNGMIITTASNMLICLVIAYLSFLKQLNIPTLLITSAALGCVTAAQAPMRLATLPRLIQRSQMSNAIGLTAILFNSSRILGPAVTAWLLTIFDTLWIFVIAGICFGMASVILTKVTTSKSTYESTNKSVVRDLINGWKFVFTHPAIKIIFILSLINGFVIRTLIELLPAVSGELTIGTPEALATLTAFAGAGSILGGLFVSKQRSDMNRLIMVVYSALFSAQIVLLPMPWVTGLWSLIPMVCIASMMMTIIGTSSQALIQLGVEQHFLGRVMGIWMVIAMGSPAIGAFVMGALADIYGIPRVFFVGTIVALVVTVIMTRQRHKMVFNA